MTLSERQAKLWQSKGWYPTVVGSIFTNVVCRTPVTPDLEVRFSANDSNYALQLACDYCERMNRKRRKP